MATTILADGAEAYTTKGGISVTRRRREAPYVKRSPAMSTGSTSAGCGVFLQL